MTGLGRTNKIGIMIDEKFDLCIDKAYNNNMRFDWNPEKNKRLKKERDISFEEIIFHLSQGDLWKIADHPDQNNYPGQKIYFVAVEDYIYMVPFVREKDRIFLKTIFPSRKATRDYLQEKEEEK